MKRSLALSASLMAATLAGLWLAAATATAEPDEFSPKLTSCKLAYNLKGWSFIYKTSKGEGRIECSNGQRARVSIQSWGGGATIGRSEIVAGRGQFSRVRSIDDLYGSYAQAEAHGFATQGGGARALTKGVVSLALVGHGPGVELGISFGRFDIVRR